MKHRIIFATGNAGKMKEIRLILEDLGCPVLSMKEAQADPEIVENGATFGENAEIKAPVQEILFWRMIPALWWIILAESLEFIPPVILVRIPPTILKIRILLIVWQA